SGHRITGAVPGDRFHRRDFAFREIRQLQVFQEQLDELIPRQGKTEIIFPLAIGAAFGTATAVTTARTRDGVAGHIFLVARQQVIAESAVRTPPKLWFMNTLSREDDLAAVVRVLDASLGGTFMPRLSVLRFRPPHETLPVGEVFSARIKSAVDNMHIR